MNEDVDAPPRANLSVFEGARTLSNDIERSGRVGKHMMARRTLTCLGFNFLGVFDVLILLLCSHKIVHVTVW